MAEDSKAGRTRVTISLHSTGVCWGGGKAGKSRMCDTVLNMATPAFACIETLLGTIAVRKFFSLHRHTDFRLQPFLAVVGRTRTEVQALLGEAVRVGRPKSGNDIHKKTRASCKHAQGRRAGIQTDQTGQQEGSVLRPAASKAAGRKGAFCSRYTTTTVGCCECLCTGTICKCECHHGCHHVSAPAQTPCVWLLLVHLHRHHRHCGDSGSNAQTQSQTQDSTRDSGSIAGDE
eukprot:scaffold117446_cov16-Tisochrysis_lutea.AAC.1